MDIRHWAWWWLALTGLLSFAAWGYAFLVGGYLGLHQLMVPVVMAIGVAMILGAGRMWWQGFQQFRSRVLTLPRSQVKLKRWVLFLTAGFVVAGGLAGAWVGLKIVWLIWERFRP